MPTSITATADAGTDVITATGHGLVTGDRFRMRNTGGALPAGLSPVTTLFAIRIDGNTLKAATSSANALAGTAIDVTDVGTGVHTLEAGLPYVEPRTAAAMTQIHHEDDNATWASLTALHGLLTGQSQSVWDGVTLAVPLTLTAEIEYGERELVVSAAAFNAAGQTTIAQPSLGDDWALFSTPPDDTIRANLPLRVGTRIKSITWHFNKASSASAMVMKLRTRNGTTNTDRDSLSDVTSGAAYTSVTRSAIDYIIASGDATSLVVQASNASHRFSHAVVVYDRPGA